MKRQEKGQSKWDCKLENIQKRECAMDSNHAPTE